MYVCAYVCRWLPGGGVDAGQTLAEAAVRESLEGGCACVLVCLCMCVFFYLCSCVCLCVCLPVCLWLCLLMSARVTV